MRDINILIEEMIKYYSGDAKRIQHFIKVYSFAKIIGELEKIPKKTLEILKVGAVTHDIGIKLCEEKYGDCSGKLQEKEGPAIAKELLMRLSYEEDIIDRVCYLIGHHHTYSDIDGIDYQILVEADFLVNMYEDGLGSESIKNAYEKIFKTKAGKNMCKWMYEIS